MIPKRYDKIFIVPLFQVKIEEFIAKEEKNFQNFQKFQDLFKFKFSSKSNDL